MLIALSAKHKTAFIDGTYGRPDSSSPLLPYWKRCNDMVLSWLLNSLHKSIRDSVIFCETASELWKELEERYGQSNKARLFQAHKEVCCISQGDLDIAAYFNKAKRLWDEFTAASASPRCTCGKCECEVNARLQNYFQDQKLIQFLMGLNESYTQVRGNILMINPTPTLSQVYSLLIQEERQRQVRSFGPFQGEGASFHVNISNSTQAAAQRRQEGRRSQLFCTHCKRSGHTMDKCYKIHGYPNSGKQTSKPRQYRAANNVWACSEGTQDPPAFPGLNQEQSKQLVQFITNLTTNASHKQEEEATTSATHMAGMNEVLKTIHCLSAVQYDAWILDSGASEHMCSERTILHDISMLQHPIYVNLPNGTQVRVTKHGKLKINNSLVLKHVLQVPDFRFNLLSIKRLCEQLKCSVEFTEALCLIQDHFQKKPQVIGRCIQGLYILDKDKMQNTQVKHKRVISDNTKTSVGDINLLHDCNAAISAPKLDVWHSRLGHMSLNKMKLVSQYVKPCCDIRNFICGICPKPKQHRLPFPSSCISTTIIFELLHIDTWGPYHTKTPAGHRYFLTIVDDFSRGTWTHLMVTKDEALTLIKKFVAMAKTQFGKIVKTIRTDNALELGGSYEALSFFAETGIRHETSCVHTPQQNGIVERKHKHLLEVSRALMFQSSVPLRYWGECVLTATHLINRMPTKVLKGKTPFEILFGKVPSYTHLRVFGSLCFITTTKQGRDKFQDRAKTCVFMGYPYGKKGYRVLELSTSRFYESRDVVFHENIFPFADKSKDNPFIFVPPQKEVIADDDVVQGAGNDVETNTENLSPTEAVQPIRRSTREHTLPKYRSDYVCCSNIQNSTCCCTLTNLSVPPESALPH